MLTLKNTSVMNFENAIRGARNPMNSWGRMDSHTEPDGSFVFGPNDLDLAMRLAKAGSDHRKYLRMVFVSVDVTAPFVKYCFPDNISHFSTLDFDNFNIVPSFRV